MSYDDEVHSKTPRFTDNQGVGRSRKEEGSGNSNPVLRRECIIHHSPGEQRYNPRHPLSWVSLLNRTDVF